MDVLIAAIEQHLLNIDLASADSRRIFHGRGHCYPAYENINIDYHPGVFFITLYKEPELDSFKRLLLYIESNSGLCVVAQYRHLPKSPTELLLGVLSELCYAQTGDMKFLLNLRANQNTGYFLDMQNTHAWLREQAINKRVLNLFSYTCAFSVAALKGGASHVVNVDMSAGVLKTGQENHQLNQLDTRSSRFMKLDILKSWGRIKKTGPFDLLVIDPPSNQRGSFVAEQDYAKVLRRIPQLLSEAGQVLACLNAPHLPEHFLLELMAKECPACTLLRRFPASDQFPEVDSNRSLKVFLFAYNP